MKDWKKVAVSIDTPILKAIEIIDRGQIKIALVVSNDNKLLGSLTDGDVRRGLLKGFSLNEPVSKVMNEKPTFVYEGESAKKVKSLMEEKHITQVPILSRDHKVIGLEVEDLFAEVTKHDNLVVLMAGGLGQRLGVLTKETPKPLLKVGHKPILETIIDSFVEFGFNKFCLSVNYKSDLIKQHFGDGSARGINIQYITEKDRMGTAGSLSLLAEKQEHPVIVMNGDLLTKINFESLLEFHRERKASATICVREYDFQVPYGVIETQGTRIKSIVEKPVHKFFVNAGVYVLNPEIIDLIPQDQFYDMPSLFERLIESNQETAVFPIREYWIDIGQKDDFEKAKYDYSDQFDQ